MGPAPELLRTDPKRFAAEARILASTERKLAAEPNRAAVERSKLEAAARRMAVAAHELATHNVIRRGLSTSAVDHVLASRMVNVKRLMAVPSLTSPSPRPSGFGIKKVVAT